MLNLLRSRRFWLILFVGATLVGFAEAAQTYAGAIDRGRPMPWARAMAATMPSWYLHLLIFPAVAWLATRFTFEPGQRARSIAVHTAACTIFGFAHLAGASWLSDFLLTGDFPLGYWSNLKRLLTIYFVSVEVLYYWAFVGVTYAVDYRAKFRERQRAAADLQLRASRLEGSLARANLEALRMQLNPHFLFNTLNAVSVLAMKGERQTVVRMLARLSDLLRMSFENNEPVVPLAEELNLLEPYLEIELVRFKDKLQVVRHIEPETLDAEVPTLLLQPLVENAVRHGISQRQGPGHVEIRSRRTGDRLEIVVRDTGPGFRPNGRERQGVGLANTRARLEQMYGDEQSLETHTAPEGGAIVRVTLPYRAFARETAFLARADTRSA